ncbi:hypothetical protein ONZ51_g5431 [Trametes cubensis]|uniref:C2H2-type domain-containing protein n=1 Tax=Trametes cubensis TaxID=1111947 RepID=A0AAD7TTX5_9APHY|nr:hypothetical protein ONZ51_g5431 [Trametes cubensis]
MLMQPRPQGSRIPGNSSLDQPPIATLHIESDSPESTSDNVSATRRQQTRRQRSSRAQEPKKAEDARLRVAARRKRAKETRLQSAGPQVCKWDGCGECLSDGNQIWEHMKTMHGASRDGRKLKVTQDIKMEDEDMEIDELADDDVPSNAAEGASGDKPHTNGHLASSWFDKVRCRWEGCRSEIQYIGLRRHIESKHIPVRGAHCPRGCGYQSNRADMLSRHVLRCEFKFVEDEAVLENTE